MLIEQGSSMVASKLVLAYVECGLAAFSQIKITVSHCFELTLL